MTLTKSPISNQKFGMYFSGFFVVLSLWGLFKQHSYLYILLPTLAAAIFLVLTFLLPSALSLPNRLWFALGELLGKVTGPFVLGIIFFGIITPIGIIGKWFGRDVLVLRKSNNATYWKERHAQSRPPGSFNNQF